MGIYELSPEVCGSIKTTWILVFYELKRDNLWREQNFSFSQLEACILSYKTLEKIRENIGFQ